MEQKRGGLPTLVSLVLCLGFVALIVLFSSPAGRYVGQIFGDREVSDSLTDSVNVWSTLPEAITAYDSLLVNLWQHFDRATVDTFSIVLLRWQDYQELRRIEQKRLHDFMDSVAIHMETLGDSVDSLRITFTKLDSLFGINYDVMADFKMLKDQNLLAVEARRGLKAEIKSLKDDFSGTKTTVWAAVALLATVFCGIIALVIRRGSKA